jgi:hypothetical protein
MAARASTAAGGRMWLLGLGSGLLLVTAAPLALLLGILLLPGVITWIADKAPDRAIPRLVGLAGLAASLHPVVGLIVDGGAWASALERMTDAGVLALAWAAQGGAWMAGELSPLVLRIALDALATAQIARLRARRNRVAEAWGLPPAAGQRPREQV